MPSCDLRQRADRKQRERFAHTEKMLIVKLLIVNFEYEVQRSINACGVSDKKYYIIGVLLPPVNLFEVRHSFRRAFPFLTFCRWLGCMQAYGLRVIAVVGQPSTDCGATNVD